MSKTRSVRPTLLVKNTQKWSWTVASSGMGHWGTCPPGVCE